MKPILLIMLLTMASLEFVAKYAIAGNGASTIPEKSPIWTKIQNFSDGSNAEGVSAGVNFLELDSIGNIYSIWSGIFNNGVNSALRKVSPDGTTVWDHILGFLPTGLAVDSMGNSVVVGLRYNDQYWWTYSFFAVRVNSTGQEIWRHDFSPVSSLVSLSLDDVVLSDDGQSIFIMGREGNKSPSGVTTETYVSFIYKLNVSGQRVWESRQFDVVPTNGTVSYDWYNRCRLIFLNETLLSSCLAVIDLGGGTTQYGAGNERFSSSDGSYVSASPVDLRRGTQGLDGRLYELKSAMGYQSYSETLTKFDPITLASLGNVLLGDPSVNFAKVYGLSKDFVVDSSSDLFMTGEIRKRRGNGSAYDTNLFVARFSKDGKLIWRAEPGPTKANTASDGDVIRVDANSVYVGGSCYTDSTRGCIIKYAK